MIRLTTLAAAAALAFALPAQADELSDLKDRYIAWRGGPAFQRATGVEAEGTGRVGAYGGPVHSWQSGDRVRDRAELGSLKTDSFVGPASAWTVTLSGQVETPSAAQQASARRQALLAFDDALQGAGGAKVTLGKPETLDGRAVRALHVSFGDADWYDLLVDPKTGELVATRVMEDQRPTLVRYADWRMVEGVRMPFQLRQRTADDPIEQSVAFTRMDIDPRIAEATWARPEPVRIYAFDQGARRTEPLAFDFYLGSRIYIPATVNGQATHVLLDSGAETTVLDKTWAEKMGIKPSASVVAVGTGGRQEAELASGVTVRIGALELKNITVALIDLAAVEKMIGRPLPVILGKEVFNELVVDLDFEGKTIAFHDPQVFQAPAGAVETPVIMANGIRSVPVSVEGGAPVQFDFDIGNGGPLIVYSAYWKAHGLLDDGRGKSKTLSGAVGGLREQQVATVRSLTFGGATFNDIPTVFTDDRGESAESNRTFGNIGLPILSRFRMYADFSHDRLFLQPTADVADPFPRDLTGLRLQPGAEKAPILMVAPGSPAEAAGIKAGEVIVAIDGVPLKQAGLAALRAKPAGSTLTVTTEAGKTYRLILKAYY
jgi:membrane-associated protease RseP (regulator of RpoE activity)